MADDEVCTICYEHQPDITSVCPQCSVKLCMKCWYSKCKLFCPICCRADLNKKRMCNVCYDRHSLFDITVCGLCKLWVCKECEINKIHNCKNITKADHSRKVFTDTFEIFHSFYCNKFLKGNSFTVLGIIKTEVGTVKVIKDFDENYNDLLLFVLDINNNTHIFHQVAKSLRLHKYYTKEFCRGVKTYLAYNKSTFQHLANFFIKLKKLRVCQCGESLAYGETDLCMACEKKKYYFKQWQEMGSGLTLERSDVLCRKIGGRK